jgi:anti-anti-sigma factor
MPTTDWSDRIAIAELSDEPQLSEDLDALCRRLDDCTGRKAVAEAPPDVILNMQAVTYLNSSNIAQLLKLRKKLSLAGRRLRVCCVQDSVWSIMLSTGLDGVFSFNDDVSTSLASLQFGG